MEFASFYGVTAPQIILLNLSPDVFSRSVAIFNNPNDHTRLKNLIEEFNIMENFLNTVPVINYVNADDRRLDYQIKRSEEFYEKGTPFRNVLTKEEIAKGKKHLKDAEQSLVPRVRVNGKLVDMSTEERQIISYFFDKKKLINRFRNAIQVNTFSEIKVFGAKLYDFGNDDGERFRRRVITKLNIKVRSKDIIDDLFEKSRRDLQALKECIKDAPTKERIKHDVRISDDGKTVLSRPDFMLAEDDDLLLQLAHKDLLKFLGLQELRTLYEMKKVSEKFTLELYNKRFNLNLTRDQYEKVFTKLEDLGLVGLNFYTKDFFVNVLDSAFISQQEEMIIDKDSSLASVIDEVDRLLKTRIKFGEELPNEE